MHDSLKNAEKALVGYEEKLGLVEKFMRSSAALNEIDKVIDGMMTTLAEGEADRDVLISNLREVKCIIDKLEE